MELNLSGKVALITGSSKGIGRGIAKALHDEGCKVALNSRNKHDLIKVACQLKGSIYIEGDVTVPEDVKRVVQEVLGSFGKLDILVCNVGSGKSVGPGKETLEEWNRIFDINFWSTINTVDAAK